MDFFNNLLSLLSDNSLSEIRQVCKDRFNVDIDNMSTEDFEKINEHTPESLGLSQETIDELNYIEDKLQNNPDYLNSLIASE